MKTYLIIGLLILFKLTYAQDNEKIKTGTPINSGFVFINGKYIEPPYTIEQKQTGYIYINNELAQITITLLDTIANPYKQDKLPEIPKEININTTFTELSNINDKNTKRRLMTAVSYYYHTRYPNEKAIIKIKEYYKSLPNIKSVEGSGGMLTIKTYADINVFHVLISDEFTTDCYNKYGIHSHYKLPTNKELHQKASEKMAQISDYLNTNKAMFFRVGKNIINFYFPYSETGFYN